MPRGTAQAYLTTDTAILPTLGPLYPALSPDEPAWGILYLAVSISVHGACQVNQATEPRAVTILGGTKGLAGSWPGTRLPGCFRAAGAGCWRALSWMPVKFGCTTYWGGAYMMLFRNRFCGASFLVGQGRGCSTMLPDLDVNPGTGYLDAAAPPLSPPPRAHRRPPPKECVDGHAVFAHPEIMQKSRLQQAEHGQNENLGEEICGRVCGHSRD